MTTGDSEEHGPTVSEDASPRAGAFKISARLSYLLIGGAALGGIALMCLVVLLLALAQQD